MRTYVTYLKYELMINWGLQKINFQKYGFSTNLTLSLPRSSPEILCNRCKKTANLHKKSLIMFTFIIHWFSAIGYYIDYVISLKRKFHPS